MKTEDQPPQNLWIDRLNTAEALSAMIKNHSYAFDAVNLALKDIEKTVDQISNILKKSNKGRIIYVGAGTSARIGVQDGAELYPTFGWSKDRVKYIVAGGKNALVEAIEGAEDYLDDVKKIIEKLKITKFDIVIALTASGKTPFTNKVINILKSKKALTISITNNNHQSITKKTDIGIVLDTGYEIIAGSTRLKAGTAQKICLNLITTLVMCNLGYVKSGLMINMIQSNKKLIERGYKIKKLLNKNNI